MSRRKAPEDRQRANRPRELRLVAGNVLPVEIPEPALGWLPEVAAAWQGFWSSELARLVAPDSDLPALRRLYDLYNRQSMLWRIFDREPMVTGSQGQQVLNPAGRLALQLETPIRHLEDRFGLSPRARLNLGIKFGSAAASLQKLAEEAGTGAAPQVDPRTLEV